MKIPIWLATIIVGAMLTGVGAAVERLSNKMDDTQKDIVALKVEVAEIKARLSPQTAQLKFHDNAGIPATVFDSPDWIYP